mmetsp:Transcript_10690/g.21294  ORF Transcript_10690/g.21294 Transcript_10690/m.21294 type:complete len:445 (+) Transcript_10690:114-1448(+)
MAKAYTAPKTSLVRNTLETTNQHFAFMNDNKEIWRTDDTSVNDLPISLGMHTSTQFTKDGYSLVYIFGGCSGEFRAIPGNDNEWPWRCTVISDYAFSYDPYTDSYRSLANMPIAKYGHTATEVDGKIWVIGGRSRSDNKDQIDHQVDIYDIKKDSWETIQNFGLATANGAAFSLKSGSLYYAGGFDDSYTATDVVIKITTTQLDKKMFVFNQVASLNVARGMVHAITTAEGAIIAGGATGANPCKVVESIEEYIPGTSYEQWDLIEGFPSGNGAHPSSLIKLGDEILAFTSVSNEKCLKDDTPESVVQALNWKKKGDWYMHGDIVESRFYFSTIALPEVNAALTFGGTTFYEDECNCMKTVKTVSAYYTSLPDGESLLSHEKNKKMGFRGIIVICDGILIVFLLYVYFFFKPKSRSPETSLNQEGESSFPDAEDGKAEGVGKIV